MVYSTEYVTLPCGKYVTIPNAERDASLLLLAMTVPCSHGNMKVFDNIHSIPWRPAWEHLQPAPNANSSNTCSCSMFTAELRGAQRQLQL
jgi:hypothetical protein